LKKQGKGKQKPEAKIHREDVTEDNVAEVVAMMTGVPVQRIAQNEGERLINMESELENTVIGQEEAIKKVVKAIRRNRAGLKDPNKPIGTFIFLGPTGVGKTYLAKVLAQYLFDSEDALVRIDMSEYMEKFAVSRLVGAPPGYVGYEEGGQLTEKIRRKPYSIVLLDEIEKAHPDVFPGYAQGVIENALKKAFAPEFLNRIDDVVIFESLEREDIYKIIDIELKHLYAKIHELGYKIKFSNKAKDFIVEKGWDEKFGARPLKRAIQKYLEDALAEEIIKINLNEGDLINIDFDAKKEEIKIKITKPKKENKTN
jgi:ATP-dependent Clp protease ATP-binding subunit ClpC